MTTIIGLRTSGYNVIYADTAITSDNGTLLGHTSKVIKCGDLFMGIAGPFSIISAIANTLDDFVPDWGDWDSNSLFKMISDLNQELIKSQGISPIESDWGQDLHFHAIIATPTGMWKVLSGREVVPVGLYGAVGSGAMYALGALATNFGSPFGDVSSVVYTDGVKDSMVKVMQTVSMFDPGTKNCETFCIGVHNATN